MKKVYEPLLTKRYLTQTYDSIEFSLATGASDYDIKNETGAFSNHKIYTNINIRSTQVISIKLNSTSNDTITLERGRPFQLTNLMEITEIFITNASGSTANIKVIGTREGV